MLTPMPKRPSEAAKLINKAFGMLLREKVPMDRYLGTNPAASVPGLLILAVIEKLPAFNGGLRKNDVITEINGTPVKTVEGGKKLFNDAVKASAENISLTVRRGNETQKFLIRIPSAKK